MRNSEKRFVVKGAYLFLFLAIFFVASTKPLRAMEIEWVTEVNHYEGPRSELVSYESFYLQMSGEIRTGDYLRFIKFFSEPGNREIWKNKADRTIYLSSDGGDFLEAIKIADVLKLLYPQIRISSRKGCASSCFFLYLAGANRHLSGSLGIHRVYFNRKFYSQLSTIEAQRLELELNKRVRLLMEENRVPRYLQERMEQTRSTDIYWLTDDDKRNLGEMPPWYEEYLIAKCDYGKVLTFYDRYKDVIDHFLLFEAGSDGQERVRAKKCKEDLISSEIDQFVSRLRSLTPVDKSNTLRVAPAKKPVPVRKQ